MSENFEKEDFLAHWADNQLSDTERVTFEESEDYPIYKAILEGTDILEVPNYNQEASFAKLKKELTPKKTRTLIPNWTYSIAASILVIFGLWYFLGNATTVHQTNYGEQLVVTLPDNSKAVVYAKSRLEYKTKWETKRFLDLDGKAYFDVEKGNTFTVKTQNGDVTVVGTMFSVEANKDIFEIICYEGKVAVTISDKKQILTQGEAVRFFNDTIESWTTIAKEPSWLQDRSAFKNAPLQQVLNALGKQYGKNIDTNKIDVNQRFTGSFTHKNLDLALQAICESMGIKYIMNSNDVIVFLTK